MSEFESYVDGYKSMFPDKEDLLEQLKSVFFDKKSGKMTVDSMLATEIVGWVAETYVEEK